MPNPRKPRALKLLEGTDRPSRDYPEPEFPAVEGAEPPDWLVSDDALAEWSRCTELLESTGVLTEGDLTALAHMCALHGEVVNLVRAGLTPTAADRTQLRLYLTEFGMTPASRSKAGGGVKKKAANPFSALTG